MPQNSAFGNTDSLLCIASNTIAEIENTIGYNKI